MIAVARRWHPARAGAKTGTCAGRSDGDTGAIAITAALCLVFCLGFLALVIDVAMRNLDHRTLQASVDQAAMDAVRDRSNALAVAQSSLTYGGMPIDQLTVVTGSFALDPGTAMADRWQPGGSPSNAVFVQSAYTSPVFLSGMFGGQATDISADAIAMSLSGVSYGNTLNGDAVMSSRVVNPITAAFQRLDQGNATGLSLSQAEIDALTATQFGIVDFLRQVANVTGRNTYRDVLHFNTSMEDMLTALEWTLRDNVEPSGDVQVSRDAIAYIRSELRNSGEQLDLKTLFDIEHLYDQSVYDAVVIDANMVVVSMLSLMSQFANSNNNVDFSLPIPDPPGGEIISRLTIEEPATGRSVIDLNPQDGDVGSGRLRIQMDLLIDGRVILPGTGSMGYRSADVAAELGIYFDSGYGNASVSDIVCGYDGNGFVEIVGTTGDFDAFLGDEFGNGNPRFDPADIDVTLYYEQDPSPGTQGDEQEIAFLADMPAVLGSDFSFIITQEQIANGETFSTSPILAADATFSTLIEDYGTFTAASPVRSYASVAEAAARQHLLERAPELNALIQETASFLGILLGQTTIGAFDIYCSPPVLVR